jgi:hypothetical protein
VVWQVAHCCLNSAAPFTGFASGKDICAGATATIDVALQNARLMTSVARRFCMTVTVGADRA